MASGYEHYILRGFSEELDRRPLHFVDPLPPARVCSACGHVCQRNGALPCGHFLCGLCYQQEREPDGGRVCPFDGEACPEASVQWREFPAEELLKKQVNCWNRGSGCSVTTAASDLSKHFHRECEHHSTPCPKCSTKVLCKGLCSHIRSCAGSQRPSSSDTAVCASGDQQSTGPTLALLSTATLQMQQQMGELKAALNQISLQELSRDVKNLEETLKQDFEKVASECRANFSRNAADIGSVKDKVAVCSKEAVDMIESVLRHTMKQSSHQWLLTGYAALTDEAKTRGSSWRNGSPVYLCGYLVLLGAYIQKSNNFPYGVNNNFLSLHMRMRLGKGDVDEYLQWPFQIRMVFSVVHPETRQKRAVNCEPHAASYFSKPVADWNEGLYFTDGIRLNIVEFEQYVVRDQLQLCVELLA